MTEVRICRYLVFWALKKVKGPNMSVNAHCKKEERERKEEMLNMYF